MWIFENPFQVKKFIPINVLRWPQLFSLEIARKDLDTYFLERNDLR